MTTPATTLALPVPSPSGKVAAAVAVPGDNTGDVRALFADVTKLTPRDEQAEKAFLASKLHVARTHPTLDLMARKAVTAQLAAGIEEAVAPSRTGPVPGGV